MKWYHWINSYQLRTALSVNVELTVDIKGIRTYCIQVLSVSFSITKAGILKGSETHHMEGSGVGTNELEHVR